MAGDLLQRSSVKEVIFIDKGVDDWQSLADGVPHGAEIVTLDPTRDGLEQMAEWAAGREGYSAIHILSHGSAGQVQLGSTSLNNDTLSGYSEALAQIGQSLTEDGDILLYGCDVAAGQSGVEFIGKLAQVTGADVAVSDDLTGADDKGGDWVLEQQVGEIQTQTLTKGQYQHVLAAPANQDFDSLNADTYYSLPYTDNGIIGLDFAASPGAYAYFYITDESTGFTTGNAAGLWVDSMIGMDSSVYVEFSSVDPDGDGPEAKPLFTLGQLAAGYYEYSHLSSYIVSGRADGEEVISVEVDLATTGNYGSGAASTITYTKSDQYLGMYVGGTLSFGDAWTNIDTVRFTVSDPDMMMGMVELLLDTIDFSEPVQEDTAPPTVAIDVADISLIASETSEVTFTFNEAVQGFSNANLTVANGTLSTVATADGGKTWTATLTPTANISDETNVITVTLDSVSDLGGNFGTGTASSNNYAINTTVPDTPTLALEVDSGASDSDGVTSSGQVNVSGLEDGATWEYSTDDGQTWNTGNGTSFTLQDDGAKSVIARQSDIAGNASSISQALSFTLDTTVSTPILALAEDNGADANDGVTSNGQVDVFGLEQGASWEYSTDDGQNWTAGESSSVTLQGDGTKSIIVRQTDVAGNASPASQTLGFTLDSPPTLISASSTPADNASDASTSVSLQLKFSEAISFKNTEGGITLYDLTDAQNPVAVESFDTSDIGSGNGTISIDGDTLTINPAQDLLLSTAYAVQISSDLIQDAVGNTFAGIVDYTTYKFTTIANTAPDITSNSGGETASINIAENSTAVTTVTATDAESDTLTYNITGGADQTLFQINSNSGALSFTTAPNFENPTDSDTDNSYIVEVTVDDSNGGTDVQTLTINVIDVNDAPVITSAPTGTVEENAAPSTVIYTATATDEDAGQALTYSLSGTDAALLNIDATSGEVTLKESADFEAKASYSFDVTATDDGDGSLSDTQAVTVSVIDVNDAPTGSVTITGTARQGAILTVSNNLADEDGMGEISYQWLRDGAEITGATGDSYTLVRADVRAEISVQARYTDGQGTAETVTSLVTDPVVALPVSPPRPEPELEIDVTPLPDTLVGESAVRETFNNISNEPRNARLVENTGNNK